MAAGGSGRINRMLPLSSRPGAAIFLFPCRGGVKHVRRTYVPQDSGEKCDVGVCRFWCARLSIQSRHPKLIFLRDHTFWHFEIEKKGRHFYITS